MQVSVFVMGSRFFTVRMDVPNRRVSFNFGKLGSAGRTVARDRTFFETNDDVRDYAEDRIERLVDQGYVQIA